MSLMIEALVRNTKAPSVYMIHLGTLETEYEENYSSCQRIMRTMKYADSRNLIAFLSGILSIRKQYARDLLALITVRERMSEAGF